jgi:ABC-2 type transport system permease protein
MTRLMKADFYRLSHTVGIYITLAVVAILGVMNVVFETSISSGINVEGDLGKKVIWDLAHLMRNTVLSSSILNYCFISIFVILIGFEFSSKTYKNSLISGTSRITFVLAKYATELLVLISATILFFMAALLAGIVKYGLGQTDLLAVFSEMLVISVVLGLMISVLFSLATMVLTLTESSVMAAVFIVMYPLIIQIIALVTKGEEVKYLDVSGFAQMVGLNQIKLSESVPYLLVSLGLILMSLVGSAFIIRHKEL